MRLSLLASSNVSLRILRRSCLPRSPDECPRRQGGPWFIWAPIFCEGGGLSVGTGRVPEATFVPLSCAWGTGWKDAASDRPARMTAERTVPAPDMLPTLCPSVSNSESRGPPHRSFPPVSTPRAPMMPCGLTSVNPPSVRRADRQRRARPFGELQSSRGGGKHCKVQSITAP